MSDVPFRCSIIGTTLLSLTTPQPTWVQGATGEIGIVPEVGSQVEYEGYHADKFKASLMVSLVILTPCIMKPDLVAGSAPEEESPNSVLSVCITMDNKPAVLGVAKEVPDVSWYPSTSS